MASHSTRIEFEAPTPIERYRQRIASNLSEQMAARGLNRKQLVVALRAEGLDVTPQAVNLWLGGKRTPRPEAQAALAKVLGVRPRTIFDIEQVA